MSWSALDTAFLAVALIDLAGLLAFLAMGLYLAYAKLDLMLEHLINCPAVLARAHLKNGGPAGRLFVLGGIIGVVTRPAIYLRDGGAIQEDLDNFPADLKRLLVVYQTVGWVLLGAMFVIFVAGKLTGWLD
ncbi:hypothetical protein [Pseudomonas sp. 1928-m]|uniref:hypothetical protein n=1 Tax=Pseudomonas sp. 1928-m TaxID=3033804 RepID=UPI0023DEE380|nr:hypothetical protein [Pseudomonas sp. 1928-m]MDF3195262.1 hypothetical protein [Pseudomonas sp. 1928-m]